MNIPSIFKQDGLVFHKNVVVNTINCRFPNKNNFKIRKFASKNAHPF